MKKILLVDDDPQILELLRDRLRSHHFEIVLAVNGEDCVNKAQQEKPDLILTDLIMPGMNGGESVRILRNNSATKNIPVVFLTAAVTHEDLLSEDKKINVDGQWYGVIAKPFDAQDLINGIGKYMANPSAA